jgi:hypothetical protein
LRAIARCCEGEGAARGGRRLGEVVNRDVKGAEVAARGANGPAQHRKLGALPGRDRRRRLDQHGDVEVVF